MFNLEDKVRANILKLEAYSSARKEYQKKEGIFLDANESPFGSLNRYPDPSQTTIKELLAKQKSVSTRNIFVGNGSDEVIDLIFRIFCNPGVDAAITFKPSYGMYDVSAGINDIELIQLDLNKQFQIDRESVQPYLKEDRFKLMLICSPNNPTGNLMSSETIEYILNNFNGIILIDEAYIDFSDQESWLKRVNEFPNLIVSQTFSKAWGLAAARVGVAYANTRIIDLFNKTKPPYNVSTMSQNAVVVALKNQASFKENVATIIKEKERLIQVLNSTSFVKKVFPSDANFILIEVDNADLIYQELINRGIVIRNRNKIIKNCLRISIGTPKENDILVHAIQTMFSFNKVF